MLTYPEINPVLISFSDHLQIRWYGVMYLLAFACCWLLIRVRTRRVPGWLSVDRLNDLMSYTAMGVILGGRLGYLLFYLPLEWLHDPLLAFKVWQGGMSFHGGLMGVMVSTWLFCRHTRESYIAVGDWIAPAIPVGLAFGRWGNFINAELWGRVTDVPWAMVFPGAGPFPRHPSQLYAILFEGFFLFTVLWIYARKPRKSGAVMGLFLMGYGIIRFCEEFFRQPDPQYGYLAFDWLTMGQLLCLPMILLGLYCMLMRNPETQSQPSFNTDKPKRSYP